MTERSSARLAASAARLVQATVEDENTLKDMDSWGFEASNVDLARIIIEEALTKSATEAELTGYTISTHAEAEAIGPTRWLSADIEADLRWTPVFSFLDKVADWPEGFRVTAFNYEIIEAPVAAPSASRSRSARSRRNARETAPPAPLPPAGKVRIGLSIPVKLKTDSVAGDTPRPAASRGTR